MSNHSTFSYILCSAKSKKLDLTHLSDLDPEDNHRRTQSNDNSQFDPLFWGVAPVDKKGNNNNKPPLVTSSGGGATPILSSMLAKEPTSLRQATPYPGKTKIFRIAL